MADLILGAPPAPRKPLRRGPFLVRENGSLVLPVRLTFYRGGHARLITLIEKVWEERQARLAAGAHPDESGVATLIVSLMISGVGQFGAEQPVAPAEAPEAEIELNLGALEL